MGKKIKLGVIGLGYLGKYHLKHLSLLNCVEIIGIYDIDQNLTIELAKQHKVKACKSLSELLNQASAVSIVTPTNTHAEIAMKALKLGCHIFIEKPICDSVKSAQQIQNNAQNRVAHVGHIERFNPAFVTFMKKKPNPLFIECHRLAKVNNRSMDISVVLDLMIHDIDLLINMINSPIKEIIADGISVISTNIDLANVKLIFENNCVANLTASRISNKNMRKIRVFETQTYTSIDLLNKELVEYSATKNSQTNELIFDNNNIKVDSYDALATELTCFCNAIFENNFSNKNISTAIDALDIAKKINIIIQDKRNNLK